MKITITEGPTVYEVIDYCHDYECSTINVGCEGSGSLYCIQGTFTNECEIVYVCDYGTWV
ncbi:MAG: hypothetical protein LBG80_15675 [Bacteroidales bacterium]|nr:hypothetical protein [Bacteroidales bacterium]